MDCENTFPGARATLADEHDVIRSWKDLRDFHTEDLRAHDVARWLPWHRYQRPALHYQRLLRVVEFLAGKRSPMARFAWILARVRLAHIGALYGLSIPPGVFGRGLSIAHIGNIVVNDRARVGRNCRLHSGTNIGEANGHAPQVGDGVYIGPGAVLFGAIEVGDGAVIGANSVVNRSVPAGILVGGVPARELRAVGEESPMPKWMTKQSGQK